MEFESLEGTVEHIVFYNEENGYTVFSLLPSNPMTAWSALDTDGLVTVVGTLPEVSPGESVQLEGVWKTHPVYGRQFEARNLRRVTPATVEGLKRYLGSGLIKGIGPRIAERIVDHFGLETLDILDNAPERLHEVAGIGEHRIRLIREAWAEQKHIQDVMLFLQGHGISTSLAVRIYKAYGDSAIAQVETDPYRLARDVHGIGFKTADRIARDMGLPADHPRRLEAGLAYALNQAVNDGHVYLPEEQLIHTAAGLLEVSPADMEPAVERAASAELIKIEEIPTSEGEIIRGVYLPPFYYAEVGVANRLRQLIETPTSRLGTLESEDWSALIADAAIEANVDLSLEQQEAIQIALTHKVSILTGGPGTGKTTTLRALIGVLEERGYSFALASPTGRAAKRLSEATGQPASTIHRLLGYSPANNSFLYDEDSPLPVDMVIVDEVSMLDITLANALFRAVDPRSHLLLVGDVDQLPSVGAGDVLRDLIASGVIEVTRLNAIFRQSEGSLIIANAHRVNQGQMPAFPEDAEDFFLFSIADDPERAADLIVDIVRNRIPRRFGLDPVKDIQVLAPMYRGPAGIARLNQRLQAALNPPGRHAEHVLAGRLFRVGDRVMQTRNNYEKEVFNGDVGRLYAFDLAEQTMTVVFDDRFVTYDWSEASELTHAYAISVHRSQGSEYPAVVMPIVTQHYMMLQRNLLYTAITRARQLVVLVGSRKAISVAVRNNKVTERFTALAERLRGEL